MAPRRTLPYNNSANVRLILPGPHQPLQQRRDDRSTLQPTYAPVSVPLLDDLLYILPAAKVYLNKDPSLVVQKMDVVGPTISLLLVPTPRFHSSPPQPFSRIQRSSQQVLGTCYKSPSWTTALKKTTPALHPSHLGNRTDLEAHTITLLFPPASYN